MNQMYVLNFLVHSVRKLLNALACPVQALIVKGTETHKLGGLGVPQKVSWVTCFFLLAV